MKTWRFSALDSLFFRESRPFDSIGGSELSTVFPPSPVTLAGAIRSAIGEHQGVDWSNYATSELAQQLGSSESLGAMRIKGVFLNRQISENHWEKMYPVPAHLVSIKEENNIKNLHFLQVGKPTRCDLGNVCLAVAPEKGIKSLDGYWLTQTGLTQVLNGQLPNIEKELIASSKLFNHEIHLGIGRNNQIRAVEIGLLYQTQHIRPQLDLAIEVDTDGLDTINCPTSGVVRLGGEGRGAAFNVVPTNAEQIKINTPDATVLGIKLILLSAAYVDQQQGYTPLPDFEKHEHNETVWKGEIKGIKLTLHCAILGKTVREGGWDLQLKMPKPVRSLIPAGSVFYCTVDDGDIKKAVDVLQTAQLQHTNSLDTELGRGLLTAGYWFTHDSK